MSDVSISPASLGIAIGDGSATITPSASSLTNAGDSTGSGIPFADLFSHALSEANDKGNIASQKSAEFAAGKSDDIHGVMIATKEADIELRLVANVKNKVVDAINDLLRMSV
jgi:flagellar hook-basal body complex protein FliE